MPVVVVPFDVAAREAYLEVYKTEGVDRVNLHLRALRTSYENELSWVADVYLRRAIEGYAFLNDPNAEDHLDSRYPAIKLGIPSYGSTHTEVAEGYISANNYFNFQAAAIYDDHRHTINDIATKSDKEGVDHAVSEFIRQHPVGEWL